MEHLFIAQALYIHYLVLILLCLIDPYRWWFREKSINLPNISCDSNPVLTQPFAFRHCSTLSYSEGSRSNENSLRLRHMSLILSFLLFIWLAASFAWSIVNILTTFHLKLNFWFHGNFARYARYNGYHISTLVSLPG